MCTKLYKKFALINSPQLELLLALKQDNYISTLQEMVSEAVVTTHESI